MGVPSGTFKDELPRHELGFFYCQLLIELLIIPINSLPVPVVVPLIYLRYIDKPYIPPVY